MPRNILLPLDPSAPANWPVPLTEAQLLLRDGGVLHVLSVLPDFGLSAMGPMGDLFTATLQQAALTQMRQAQRLWINQTIPVAVTVEPHVRTGDPAAAILDVSEAVKADVIVLGSPATARPDLGETIRTVALGATASVYLVRV
jgi:nucleotide-binding universal stress UspA family protein